MTNPRSPLSPSGARTALSSTCSLEDHGDAFFLILEQEGFDLTLALSNDVALRVAEFLTQRLSMRPQ